ncbi:hypothetical protein QN277_010165 [Acacia crassicarpa]|uniref:Protein kinase domain-containing protein n=1 Tax=Acacia crassicarpa TaxID=499986 RepID=A0AAE1INI4_9FABA|nr:hypothetical protein QN277_010165 [Acacia crassicarpa]
MSRVVAMLSGDMEVSTVTSRPGYLTDWKFDDKYTFMTSLATKGSDMTQYNSSATASQSPVDASEAILPHIVGEELLGIDPTTYIFSYFGLKNATGDFIPDNKLGEGGFRPVYKGTLSDGRVVAVKQLSVESHQGKSQFIIEIATISAAQHRNLVKLYGCCLEGEIKDFLSMSI